MKIKWVAVDGVNAMARYTDTENTGTPAVPVQQAEDDEGTLTEVVWSHRID